MGRLRVSCAAMRGAGSMIFSGALRIVLYTLLGWLGLNALTIALFGYLNYAGALIFPVVVVLAVVGVFLAVTARGDQRVLCSGSC